MSADAKDLAAQTWSRYAWLRDNGHRRYVAKADQCEQYFRGDQWSSEDMALLRAQRRPALTINKILSTVSSIMGEQIFNRSEISFRPRSDASSDTADILTKLYKQVSDTTQLDWKRSDMFADGIITSRGYLDIRMDYEKNINGDIDIQKLNGKNVLVDNDAEDGDPDTWSEVFVTKWMTIDEIAVLYGKKQAEELRAKDGQSSYAFGYDSIDFVRDRFGDEYSTSYGAQVDTAGVQRNIRVIERQYRKLDRQPHFIEPKTGEQRPVPEAWTAQHTQAVAQQFGLKIIKKLCRRIRWTIIADNIVLHDAWSPYSRFTVIPYFPFFRHGHTVGCVENLIGPQELLNKTSSQELHIVNTTANSGWIVKTGMLTNMSIEELEQKGSTTGLVVEVNELDAIQKISPNSTPSGIERISYKAEEHIKTISGVSDTMQGQDREDVAAKAMQEKKKNGSTALAKPLDSLIRTDFYIARMLLDLFQEFYTDERVVTVVHDDNTGATTKMSVNQVDPATGEVLNDITLGEYDVVVGSVPVRETLEDSQFDQAMAMKEAGISIPDAFIIGSSRLMKKQDLIKQIQAQSNSPQAQKQQQLQMQELEATVAKLQAEVEQTKARAQLDTAKAGHQQELAQKEAQTPPEMPQTPPDPAAALQIDQAKAAHDMDLKSQESAHKQQMAQQEMGMKQQESQHAMDLASQAAADKAASERVAAAQKSRQPTARA